MVSIVASLHAHGFTGYFRVPDFNLDADDCPRLDLRRWHAYSLNKSIHPLSLNLYYLHTSSFLHTGPSLVSTIFKSLVSYVVTPIIALSPSALLTF
jgi:hypothetical protein